MSWKNSIDSRDFQKLTFFVEILKIWKISPQMTNPARTAPLLYELFAGEPVRRCTTRCHTKTIAKQARVGPRTQMPTTMKNMFCMIVWSTSARLSDMIVLDNVLEISMELMK